VKGNTKRGPSINQFEEVQGQACEKGGFDSLGEFGPRGNVNQGNPLLDKENPDKNQGQGCGQG
jgi:hypothetical protein